MSANSDILDVYVGFIDELRSANVKVGSDELMTFLQGLGLLDPSQLNQVYFTGKSTLVHRKDQIPTYNRVFKEYFLNQEKIAVQSRRKKMNVSSTHAAFDIPDNETEGNEPGGGEFKLGRIASGVEIFREKNFRECTQQELRSIYKIINLIASAPPMRTTRRYQLDPNGRRIALRKMVRQMAMRSGEIESLQFLKKRRRVRGIVFLLDVSGSMADYSRHLLQLAYALKRAHGDVEAFCFGTRLSRITNMMARRNPDEAMKLAGSEVLDWDGGTQIGKSIKTLLRQWGRKGTTRGSIVIICSDGLDRGNPQDLYESMESLARLSHSILWVNPIMQNEEEVDTMALRIAEPYIDKFFSGANLKSMEKLALYLANYR